ncbi:hypothetical protein J2792_002350 [Novosphingobium capsulatum]|uniref:Uncharacterized protein n=2 Tax=Novosphingobium capsulatum TaxID=13688 RepID=A0ABU1MMC5_9SPHN|nr:hypothetical protein [Novosphingobium capsulatum]
MAKTAGLISAWTRDLDAMIEVNAHVRAYCGVCKKYQDIDIPALRERVGGSYSLLNRRCKCRLTPGCKGWNKFMYLHGVMRILADEETRRRWESDWMRK